jgi:hypothetical protein
VSKKLRVNGRSLQLPWLQHNGRLRVKAGDTKMGGDRM